MTAMSKRCNGQETVQVFLFVAQEQDFSRFTTFLQSGIYLSKVQGTRIGSLLLDLPGFTEQYIKRRVQTIFVNGLPADSLEQQLFGDEAVVAISAAMPGLAGAIFRKDGVHASLRTKTAANLSGEATSDQIIQICLKLFNMIAVEKGNRILADGCIVKAPTLGKFLAFRPSLLETISKIVINGRDSDPRGLTEILAMNKLIRLTIGCSHES